MNKITSHPELVRRWTMIFKFYDMDGDGLMSRKDFDILQENILQKTTLTAEKKAEVLKLSADFWESYIGKDEANSQVNLADYVALMGKGHKNGITERWTYEFRTRIFYCMDLDGDNHIDFREYKIFSDCLGKSETPYMEKAFKAIDTDGNGLISLEEYLAAYNGYVSDVSFDARKCPLFGLDD